MTTPLLEINDLVVSYQTAKGLVHAVNNVSLEVHPGQITAIVGEIGRASCRERV